MTSMLFDEYECRLLIIASVIKPVLKGPVASVGYFQATISEKLSIICDRSCLNGGIKYNFKNICLI